MKTLRTDHNNDICLCDAGKLHMLDGIESIMNRCENYARATMGEMLWRADKGIPYFQTAFGARPDVALFEAYFRRRMAEVKGVRSVLEFEAEINNNVLSYRAVISTDLGNGEIRG